MKVLKAAIDHNEGYMTAPKLHLLVDKIPDNDEMIYDKKGSLYFAEKDGYVSFFYYTFPGEGYAGRVFKLKMKDGTTKELEGPWSSNSSAMNVAGFKPCIEVSLTDDPQVFIVGHTYYASSVTVELAEQALKLIHPELSFYIGKVEKHKERSQEQCSIMFGKSKKADCFELTKEQVKELKISDYLELTKAITIRYQEEQSKYKKQEDDVKYKMIEDKLKETGDVKDDDRFVLDIDYQYVEPKGYDWTGDPIGDDSIIKNRLTAIYMYDDGIYFEVTENVEGVFKRSGMREEVMNAMGLKYKRPETFMDCLHCNMEFDYVQQKEQENASVQCPYCLNLVYQEKL